MGNSNVQRRESYISMMYGNTSLLSFSTEAALSPTHPPASFVAWYRARHLST